jgi:RNA-directed DNA polymerase
MLVNYFSITKAKELMKHLDESIRARLRMCEWKLWKKVRTRIRKLISLGMKPYFAIYQYPKGYWHTVKSIILLTTMTNQYIEALGCKILIAQYSKIHVN